MSSVEHEIWDIFVCYALRGNPLELASISVNQFTSFARESGIIGLDGILEADITVSYKAEVPPGGKMNFSGFLNTVANIARKVYPDQAQDAAFQRLMGDQILQYAARLAPQEVDVEDVAVLHKRVSKSLKQLFQYYASEASEEQKETVAACAASSQFNPRMNVLSHKKYLEFASDFNLTKSSMITAHDLGAIFMASQKRKHMDDAGCLTFEDFWEMLCRCALVAYADKRVPLGNKLKALFLLMTREIKWSDSNCDGDGLRGVDSNPHHFYLGAKQFQKAVTAQWLDDDKQDYLNGANTGPSSATVGRDLLAGMKGMGGGRLLTNGTNGTAAARSSPGSSSSSGRPNGAGAGGGRSVLGAAAAARGGGGDGARRSGGTRTQRREARREEREGGGAAPSSWREVLDSKTGRNYYYNVETRKTTWVDPR